MKPATPVSDEQVDLALVGSAWRRDGAALLLERRCRSFAEALGFVVSVGALAEAACHHPDIELRYDLVRLRVSTHEIGGLSIRDLDLAAAVDDLA